MAACKTLLNNSQLKIRQTSDLYDSVITIIFDALKDGDPMGYQQARIKVDFKLRMRDRESLDADVIYVSVQLVAVNKEPTSYATGNYQRDIAQARFDGWSLGDVLEDPTVALFENLVSAKPEERYAVLARNFTSAKHSQSA
jgi:hypothetical protein